MKKVSLHELLPCDIIKTHGHCWFVERVDTSKIFSDFYSTVRVHDCNDIYHIRHFTDSSKKYTIINR